MDPLSALSVATAVVQFLDFTGAIVSGTWKIYRSNPGDSERSSDIRSITESLIKVNDDLHSSINIVNSTSISSQDREIAILAKRCNEIGERLLATLDRLQSQSRHQFWASFRIALRTLWSQSEIDTLQETLGNYRQQVSIYILVSLREQITATNRVHQQDLLETQQLCRKIMAQVAKNNQWQDEVVQAIKHSYWQGTSLNSSTPIYGTCTKYDQNQLCRALLSNLRFREMDYRYEKIAHTHAQTFEWVFQPPAQGTKWTDFSAWLSNGEPLYWITGKAGAGKSTLMRFIFDHRRTRRRLRQWSSGTSLIIASFFFWNSGSEMQMSYNGLMRTLLHQILEQRPDLLPIVLPHRMEVGILFGEHAFQRDPWTWEELLRAFKTLIHQVTKTSKIVLFVDGMDEFRGKPSDLISLVISLLTPGVKICASSRPWVDFEDAFGHRPHLRLEDLTYNDIKSYVSSKMAASPGFRVHEQLDPHFSSRIIENICTKSSGVFLWVYLVVQSLLDGLAEGESLFDLQKRLQSLPVDLETLFWRVLDHLNSRHFVRASQLFQIVRASLSSLSLLELSFADEDDPDFVANSPRKPLSNREAVSRAELMRRRINACCKGLLEACTVDKSRLPSAKVGYLHRTVKDFLERKETWETICAASPADFNPYIRLCNSQIMRLIIHNPETLNGNGFWNAVTYGIEYAVRADPDASGCQMNLLETIDEAADEITTVPRKNGLNFLQWGIRETGNAANYWTGTDRDFQKSNSFLEFAVQCQLTHYVKETLASFSSPPSPHIVSRLLWLAVAHFYVFPTFSDRPSICHDAMSRKLIRVLLKYGADPNWIIGNDRDENFTIWDRLINDSAGRDHLSIVKDFLKYGADPRNNTLIASMEYFDEDIRALIKQKKKETRWSHYGSLLHLPFSGSRPTTPKSR